LRNEKFGVMTAVPYVQARAWKQSPRKKSVGPGGREPASLEEEGTL